MLDILKFIFSGFWHFIGAVILLGIVAHGLSSMFTVRVKHTHVDYFDDEDHP